MRDNAKKSITINGIPYESMTKAALAYDIKYTTLVDRVRAHGNDLTSDQLRPLPMGPKPKSDQAIEEDFDQFDEFTLRPGEKKVYYTGSYIPKKGPIRALAEYLHRRRSSVFLFQRKLGDGRSEYIAQLRSDARPIEFIPERRRKC